MEFTMTIEQERGRERYILLIDQIDVISIRPTEMLRWLGYFAGASGKASDRLLHLAELARLIENSPENRP